MGLENNRDSRFENVCVPVLQEHIVGDFAVYVGMDIDEGVRQGAFDKVQLYKRERLLEVAHLEIKERDVKNLTRRDFLRFGVAAAAGVAGAVKFPMLGRRLALASPGSNFFTIALISDTQNYVDVTHRQPLNRDFFLSQTKYLADNMKDLNLAFVTHVGDVVQHGDGTNGMSGDSSYGAGAEWANARAAMDILAATGLPFGMSIGNHDYDNHNYVSGDLPLVSNVWWKKYFGSRSTYFAGKSWYGGASDNLTVNPGLSSYQTFSAYGRKFLHISLEVGTRGQSSRVGTKGDRLSPRLSDHRHYSLIPKRSPLGRRQIALGRTGATQSRTLPYQLSRRLERCHRHMEQAYRT